MAMQRLNELFSRLTKRLLDVRLSTKIIGPFVLTAVIISIIGGFILSTWLVGQLEIAAREHLIAGQNAADQAFAKTEENLQNYARAMRATHNLPDNVRTKDTSRIRQDLIPQMVSFGLDFFEVLDNRGRVILNNNGPYPENTDLNSLQIVQSAAIEMNIADLVKTPSGQIIAGIAPIKDQTGRAGYILVGYYVTAKLLGETEKISGHKISVFSEDGLIATTMKGRPEAACISGKCHTTGYTTLISRQILKGEGREPTSVNMLGKPYLITHAPLKLHGEPVAFYSVIMPMSSVVQVQRNTQISVGLLSILVNALIIGIGYTLSRTLTTPLRDLSLMAQKVTRGDLTPRSRYIRADEIGELATSFNQMTESLQRYTDSLRRRVLELSILYESGLAISSTFEPVELLKLTLNNVTKALHVDYGSIMLLGDKKKELTIKAAYGLPKTVIETTKTKLGKGIAGLVAKSGKPLLLNKDACDEKYKPLLAKEHINSAISVPLKVRKETLGVINVGRGTTKAPFIQEDVHFLTTLANQAAVAIENAALFEDIHRMYLSTVRALAEAIDAKDHYTRGHSAQVAKYAVAIGKEIGLPRLEVDGIETAAYLHDIGKIGISDEILRKPGKLSSKEMEIIKTHPEISAKILQPIKFPWEIVPIVYHHHERYSGGGYPDKISQDNIHIGARILLVADAYEAMTSERPYRSALSQKHAIEELKRGSGSQFDPKVVEAFLNVLTKEKGASLQAPTKEAIKARNINNKKLAAS